MRGGCPAPQRHGNAAGTAGHATKARHATQFCKLLFGVSVLVITALLHRVCCALSSTRGCTSLALLCPFRVPFMPVAIVHVYSRVFHAHPHLPLVAHSAQHTSPQTPAGVCFIHRHSPSSLVGRSAPNRLHALYCICHFHFCKPTRGYAVLHQTLIATALVVKLSQ